MNEIEKLPLWDKINNFLKKYVNLNDEREYDIIISWILHTRMYEDIGVTPYIKLHGVKGSGKTVIMEVCQQLVENGEILSDVNKAQLIRSIKDGVKVFFLDEFENMSWKDSNNMEGTLNSGYKKSGQTTRCQGDAYVPVKFSTFCPKMFATKKDIKSDTLNDRIIEIITSRANKKLAKIERLSSEERIQLSNLRREMAVWVEFHKKRILENYDGFDELYDREAELINPLWCIAVEACKGNEVLSYYLERKNEKQEISLDYDWSYKLLVALNKIATTFETKYYVREISDEYTSAMKRGISPPKTGREMRKLGFKPSGRDGDGVYYHICKKIIKDAIERNHYEEHFKEYSEENERSVVSEQTMR